MSTLRKLRTSLVKTNVDNRLCMTRGADVASAATITLGNGNYFSVTGTTNIDYITITDWTPGSFVILKFNGSLTLNHETGSPVAGTSAAMTLAASGNVSVGDKDMVILCYDGSTWRQVTALLAI
jgi:hypothetical protein